MLSRPKKKIIKSGNFYRTYNEPRDRVGGIYYPPYSTWSWNGFKKELMGKTITNVGINSSGELVINCENVIYLTIPVDDNDNPYLKANNVQVVGYEMMETDKTDE
jgi:hypothetical protein